MSMTSLVLAAAVGQLPTVEVTADNTEITQSCIVRIASELIPDDDRNGVLRLTGSDMEVRFEGMTLRGAAADTPPDACRGTGIVITGSNVRVTGAAVSGFKVGMHAVGANGLVVEDCRFDDNFRQRLGSTVEAEDSADWLWPHENDEHQWRQRYGAAVYVEEARGVTLRRLVVRRGQNGIVLDRVEGARVVDNDCSFLSGWGLALWRSSRNLVSRNAFDFCIRGYSHEVYNRGQDSAGILMFEQCSENLVIENSATHGGDGFFGFAGREALGDAEAVNEPDWYRRRGNNRNLLLGNDFSFAAAHGIEMTFSFDNQLLDNTLVGNAICGVWGGYSQDTLIAGNRIARNGEMAYGLERGGVNIEHGCGNRIVGNAFEGNACGVHLWWDEDPHLLRLPWAAANPCSSDGNEILGNTFRDDLVAIQLRESHRTTIRNQLSGVTTALDADEMSRAAVTEPSGAMVSGWVRPTVQAIGDTRPVGGRPELRGRQHIIMTEWGPWDHREPLVRPLHAGAARDEHTWELRRLGRVDEVQTVGTADRTDPGEVPSARVIAQDEDVQLLRVRCPDRPGAHPYHFRIVTADGAFPARGVFVRTSWDVRCFPLEADPREDHDRFVASAGSTDALAVTLPALDLVFENGGPGDLLDFGGDDEVRLPTDHFGTVARTAVPLPPGRWRITTRSDDGIRVTVDDRVLIDDWTHHAPRSHTAEFEVTGADRAVAIRVEHFELDGYAVLQVRLEPAD